jgi:hypothetical protein
MPGNWKLELTRSGGFAGISQSAELDSGELGADEAAEVERLFDDLAGGAGTTEAPGGADRFQYDLALERGGERRQVTVGEGQMTRDQRALVKRLMGRRPAG